MVALPGWRGPMRRSTVALIAVAIGCTRTLDLPPLQTPPQPGSIELTLAAGGHVLAGARARIVAAGLAATADGQGKVRFGGLPEGSYTVEATAADGSAATVVDRVAVFAGKTTDLGQVALPATGSLHGKATLGAASGNAGIVVFIPLGGGVALTADDGSWRLDGLAPGSYQLAAAASGRRLARSDSVEVHSATDTVVADLALSADVRQGAISGSAHRLTARGLAGSEITVTLAGAGRVAATDAEGSYRFDAVPEARYTAVSSAPC